MVEKMNRTLRLSIAVTSFSAALLITLLLGWSDTSLYAQQGDTPTPTPERDSELDIQVEATEDKVSSPGYSNLDSDLNRIVERMRVERMRMSSGLAARAAAKSAPLNDGRQSVAATLYVAEGYADAVASWLEANGASPRSSGVDYIEAYIPVRLLAQASIQEGVTSIQAIVPPQPAQGVIVSEGAAAHGAPSWHAAGYKGEGVKIGIIDSSFSDFAGLQGTELPSTVSVRCYTALGRFSSELSACSPSDASSRDTMHGTAVTEAVFDIAPEATYYIANPYSFGDLQSTTDWMVEEGVDVINMSLAWLFGGPGDGTSPYTDAAVKSVDAAVTGGATWVNAAGNYAEDSWRGAFSDSDSDGFLEFNSSGGECNQVSVSLGPNGGLTAQLRWDDSWGGSSKNLDLYMLEVPEDSNLISLSGVVARSARTQTGGDWDMPYERMSLSYGEITNGEYCFAVKSTSGDTPSWVQLVVWGNSGSLGDYVAAGSISNPANSKNAGMLAVGAAPHSDTSTIESFSSRGPTADDRIKPDIVGADGGNSKIWGHWGGTSQSSPHVAGLAALVKQRFPSYTPS
ncbi:MAG: S8 family serine peptidase, partial [Chloroflexi bacterium]|nr:S8 family serine peptidase [Chloroflexota bacterium]